MIVVSAATGEFGRLVVDQLLNRVPASDVAAAVRDVHKAADLADRGAQLRHGDNEEPDSLRDSFNGADRLLFISAPSSDSGSGNGSTTTSLTRRGPAALAISSTPADWEPMSAMKADWPTTTPVSGPSETVVCRTRSCGTRSIRSGSSIQVCGGRLRPVSLRAAAGQGDECGSPSRPRRGRRSRADWPKSTWRKLRLHWSPLDV
jgi:hypothetical protein